MNERTELERNLLAVVIAAAFIAYFPSVFNGFTNWDDGYHVVNNPDILHLSVEGLGKVFSSFYVAHYIPLVILSFAVEHSLFGLDPFVFHFTNILLHVITSVLVYMLARRWRCGPISAFAAALIFAVHPIHVEAVAWVSARKDMLSSVLLFASLLMYERSRAEGGTKEYVGSQFLYLLSLLSKASGMFLPFFFLAHAAIERRLDRKEWLRLLPMFLLSVAASVTVTMALDNSGGLHPGERYGMLTAVAVACRNIVFYALSVIAPVWSSPVHPFPDLSAGALPSEFLIAPLLLLFAAAASWHWRERMTSLFVPLLFFVTALLPTLQLVPFGSMIAADRFAYLASAGLLIAGARAGSRIAVWRPSVRTMLLTALGAVTLFFGALTWQRSRVWFNSESLWTSALEHHPEFSIAYYSRGQYYFSIGNYAKAETDLDSALVQSPYYPDALAMRGYLYAVRGNNAAARSDFDRAIALQPGMAMPYYNRALLFYRSGTLDSAYRDLSITVKNDPAFIEAYVYRARILMEGRSNREALQDLTTALALKPEHLEALILRGRVGTEMGRFDEARADLFRSLALDPENADAHRALSVMYGRMGIADSATIHMERTDAP